MKLIVWAIAAFSVFAWMIQYITEVTDTGSAAAGASLALSCVLMLVLIVLGVKWANEWIRDEMKEE
jgi:hypothetical protein